MRHSALVLLAASSLLWLAAADAATRSRYGGTLRVATRMAPSSLDPLDTIQSGSPESDRPFSGRLSSGSLSFGNLSSGNLSTLIFDTLVTLDDRGRPQAALAVSWQQETGGQRWQFKLRDGVTFQDGTAMTAEQVSASLRAANPKWKVLSAGDEIIVELDSPAPDLPAQLATFRNGIAKRGGTNIVGTGPFGISEWQPGKKLTLAANNEYWGGRPFLDLIEISMGQGFQEQAMALDLGKAEVIEIAPEQAHRAAGEDRHIESSLPTELMALAFAHDPQTADEGRLRQALALSIDRGALSTVLLQGGGEPAGGLLPNWMTGYEFLFPTNADLSGARQARGEVRQGPAWTLAYDAIDPLARLVAERIVLNARDVGILLQPAAGKTSDLQLVRIPMVSLDARIALTAVADCLRLPPPKTAGTSSEDLYAAESMVLNSRQVIPLLHLRASYGMTTRVRNWSAAPNGSWHLSEIWLSPDK